MKAITKKRPYEYSDVTKEVVKLISYPRCIPDVVGSASMKFEYSNDVDLFSIVNVHSNFETQKVDVWKSFCEMFREFKTNKNLYFIELMAGVDKEGKALKWEVDEVIDNRKGEYRFTDILNQQSVIKIEIVYYFNGVFTPYSNVFEFKKDGKGINQKETTIDTIPSLAKEV